MSIDTPTPAVEDTPTALTDLSREYAQILAFEGVVKDAVTLRKNTLQDRLVELHEDTGTKTIVAKDEDKNPLLNLTLKDSAEGFIVSDPEAFLAWVEENYPTEVEIVVQVKPAFQKSLLTKKRLSVVEEGILETDAGHLVDGVAWKPKTTTNTIHPTWQAGGKEAALASFGDNLVESIMQTAVADQLAIEAAQ